MQVTARYISSVPVYPASLDVMVKGSGSSIYRLPPPSPPPPHPAALGSRAKGPGINNKGGGDTKWANRGSVTFCAPPPLPPSKQGKTFLAHPLLKGRKHFAPPFSMVKTSSSRGKTAQSRSPPPPPHPLAWLQKIRPPFLL